MGIYFLMAFDFWNYYIKNVINLYTSIVAL